MSEPDNATRLTEIIQMVISLMGLVVFYNYFFPILNKLLIVGFVPEDGTFQIGYYLSQTSVQMIGAGIGVLMVWKAEWFAVNLIAIDPDTKITVGNPAMWLQVMLISLAVAVIVFSLPSAIIELLRYTYSEPEMTISYSFWKFSGASYATNFLRSLLAGLVLVFHRPLSIWFIGEPGRAR